MMNALTVLLIAVILWSAPPLGFLMAFSVFYSINSSYIATWHFGPGVSIGYKLTGHSFYWCPVGFVAYEVEVVKD